jgi:hypothetical protein
MLYDSSHISALLLACLSVALMVVTDALRIKHRRMQRRLRSMRQRERRAKRLTGSNGSAIG